MKIDVIKKIITKAPPDPKKRMECYASILGFDLPSPEEWEEQSQLDEHGNKPNLMAYADSKLDPLEESELEVLLKKLEEKKS